MTMWCLLASAATWQPHACWNRRSLYVRFGTHARARLRWRRRVSGACRSGGGRGRRGDGENDMLLGRTRAVKGSRSPAQRPRGKAARAKLEAFDGSNLAGPLTRARKVAAQALPAKRGGHCLRAWCHNLQAMARPKDTARHGDQDVLSACIVCVVRRSRSRRRRRVCGSGTGRVGRPVERRVTDKAGATRTQCKRANTLRQLCEIRTASPTQSPSTGATAMTTMEDERDR